MAARRRGPRLPRRARRVLTGGRPAARRRARRWDGGRQDRRDSPAVADRLPRDSRSLGADADGRTRRPRRRRRRGRHARRRDPAGASRGRRRRRAPAVAPGRLGRLRGRALAAALAFAGPAGRGPDAPATPAAGVVRRVRPGTLEIDAPEHQPLHEEAGAGARRPARVPRLLGAGRARRAVRGGRADRGQDLPGRPRRRASGRRAQPPPRRARARARLVPHVGAVPRRSAGRPSGPAGSTTARSSSARRATSLRSPTTGPGSTC